VLLQVMASIKWDNVFAARPAGDAEEPAVN
jgi:hypothetical protein